HHFVSAVILLRPPEQRVALCTGTATLGSPPHYETQRPINTKTAANQAGSIRVLLNQKFQHSFAFQSAARPRRLALAHGCASRKLLSCHTRCHPLQPPKA